MREFNWDAIPMSTGATADPAAGADWAVITVPTGKKWLLYGLGTSLVTDVNAANRRLLITVQHDGANTDFGIMSQTNQTLSLTCVYSWVNGLGAEYGALGNGYLLEPWSAMELKAAATITSVIQNKQVGDNATPMRYYYKEAPV